MNDELPDLDPDLVAALEAERSRPDLDRAHHDALWSRLETSLGGDAPDGSDGGDAGGSPGGDAGGSPGGAGDGGGLVASGAAVTRTTTSIAAWVASAFVAGAGVGAFGYAALAPPEIVERERVVVHVVEREAPVRDEPAAVEAPVQSAETQAEIEAAPAEPVVAERPSRPERTRDDGAALRAERALVETARSALARGDAVTALGFAERHARAHPDGVMREEREVLAIQALAALGRDSEARARAARFAREFPGSLFAPTIREALRSRHE